MTMDFELTLWDKTEPWWDVHGQEADVGMVAVRSDVSFWKLAVPFPNTPVKISAVECILTLLSSLLLVPSVAEM